MSNYTAKSAIAAAIEHLERIDAEILLCHILKKSRTWLYTHFDQILTEIQVQEYQKLVAQRQQGVPIAYLIGTREFWSLPLQVTQDTLIPRAETELLVEKTLELIQKPNAKILELGTGSGAISIALASERPDWQIFACDINPNTIKVANANACNLGYKNIRFFCSNWLNAINKLTTFDAIISNPPYLSKDDPHQHQADLRFEPINALVSGPSGLEALQHIIFHSKPHLKPNGYLLLEHGYTQKDAVLMELRDSGYADVGCGVDLLGHPRVSWGALLIRNQ